MDFLVRFTQTHETFRLPELRALATITDTNMEIISYSAMTPFTHIRLQSVDDARNLISRAIVAQSIHELWGQGLDQESLYSSVRACSSTRHLAFATSSFRFNFDSFRGSRSQDSQINLINGFSFLGFKGPIKMKDPDEIFTIFEEWADKPPTETEKSPTRLFMGRLVGLSSRDQISRYDLKKRAYISTTSMDSELALITANLALAGPGKLFYDPFVGTGSFPLAAAHFGAFVFGSDIDGRTLRGTLSWTGGMVKKEERNLKTNFSQYSLEGRFGDAWVADLTHSPLQADRRWLDGIMCDPPYGVRESLQVLGHRSSQPLAVRNKDGMARYMEADFVPSKKPYSFHLMLGDILCFASSTLVDGGRISFWMPTSNYNDQEIPVPTHPCLELVDICVQQFSKWSRRLLTYHRIPDLHVSAEKLTQYYQTRSLDILEATNGVTANELNPFRKAYFTGFEQK